MTNELEQTQEQLEKARAEIRRLTLAYDAHAALERRNGALALKVLELQEELDRLNNVILGALDSAYLAGYQDNENGDYAPQETARRLLEELIDG